MERVTRPEMSSARMARFNAFPTRTAVIVVASAGAAVAQVAARGKETLGR